MNRLAYLFLDMANASPLRNKMPDRREPVNISNRAEENLKFIRDTMERSTSFTAVPGYGGMLMGATAIAAAMIANMQAYLVNSQAIWLGEAVLAFAIGLLAMWQKSKIAGQSLVSAPARKFALSFAPPLLAGVVIVLGLWLYEQYYVMAPVCIVCYGAAIVCGGAFSVRIVPIMGWLFMAFGAIAFLLPSTYGNLMMGISFGALHLIFGAIIARKYGG
ncbi:MAG: hypothetical protein ACJ72Z_03510 [Pyrinomonadaceae bacterium]